MTERQQYRVIADRDKGDDPYAEMREPGDRVTYGNPAHIIVRIERPVPTTDEPQPGRYDGIRADLATMARQERTPDHWAIGRNQRTARAALLAIDELSAQPSPHPPTREQIADAIRDALDAGYGIIAPGDMDEAVGNVLALIQNGADR